MTSIQEQRAETSHQTDERQDKHQPGLQDVSRPSLEVSKLRDVRLKDYGIRFAFGGAISVLAALIGVWTTSRLGGVFTAFPAILLASLTLIGEKSGREQSAEDAEGGVLGAIAFVAAAAFIALTVTRVAGIVSLLASLCLWLAIAIGVYLVCIKIGLLRTYKQDAQQEQHQKSGDAR